MSLAASCPRCSSPVTEDDDGWRCLDHGRITPLWRPAEASYEALTEHLLRCTTVPTLLPWPLSPGWTITDFGCVGSPRDGEARASLASCSGPSDLGDGPPHAKVRVDGRPVSLWWVSTSHSDSHFNRSVFAGEAQGRWLWLVMRPASAALLLNDEWILLDVSDLGPELMELPFGGHPPPW